MNEIQIVEAPIESGVTLEQVKAKLEEKFPEFRIAGVLEDKAEGLWRAKLVKGAKLHHRVAEFPPAAEEESEPSEEAPKAAPKKKAPPKDDSAKDGIPEPDADDSADDPDLSEGDDADDLDDDAGIGGGGDDLAEAKKLVDVLKKVLPQLEKLVGPAAGGHDDLGAGPGDDLNGGGDAAGLGDLGIDMHDAPAGGPSDMPPAPHGGRPQDALPGGAMHGGPAQHGTPLPPHRPPVAPGAGPRPRPAPMSPDGLSTFTQTKVQLLERDADVPEKIARQELLSEFEGYRIAELKRVRGKYVAKLVLN